jgi:TIR domain
MPRSLSCFWSYSHQDDTADGGRIAALARQLADEFSLLTGRDLEIFVDRTAIEWGDLWRERIGGSLSEVTFFIPIITPRYFTRRECRRELLEFTSQARSLGVEELLMPILYVAVEDLASDNPDEAVAMISRAQYADWTKLRLLPDTAVEYRKALNALALRLADVASRIAATQIAFESETDVSQTSDLVESIGRLEASWPELIELVEEDLAAQLQWQALWSSMNDRISRMRRSGRGGAGFAVIQRTAPNFIATADARISRAKRYSALAIELDPLMISLIRGAAQSPEIADHLAQFRFDTQDILSRKPDIDTASALAFMDDYAKVSAGIRQARDTFMTSQRYSDEGNRILEEWGRQLQSITDG